LEPGQLATSILTVFLAASLCGVLVFERGAPRRWGYGLLVLCAMFSMWGWIRFGNFHSVFIDADGSQVTASRKKIERHQPFHFHEFFHYYIGAKYFRELGYVGLYDCAALADRELALQEGVPTRIDSYVRDLDDVLTDKTYDEALAQCQRDERGRFTAKRWESFKSDLRDLRRLIPDDWWNGAVFDAGFNPPPSWILLSSTIANLIPIHVGSLPSYLLATSLDFALLVVCFASLRSSFGALAAVLATLYFGASFVSHFGWNGGAFLRFTWLTSIVLSLGAMKRGRWELAGALLGAATCDRLFPAGFAVFAMVPVAWRFRSPADRVILRRFGVGFAASVLILVAISWAIFGWSAWRVFFSRITRHSDIYFVMHIGLKKIITFRDWVYSKNFHGHEGLLRFRAWNLRLRETWVGMRYLTLPLQALAVAGTVFAARGRRPYEAAVLGGIVFMFVFNLPANYYYAVVALVPALLFRAAATTTSIHRRYSDYVAFSAFNAFWLLTIIAPKLAQDDIVYNYYICVAFGMFLVIWLLAWLEPQWGFIAAIGKKIERASVSR
jgi:hypothetical protein